MVELEEASKKDSGKTIFVVQVYFSGKVTIAQALTSTVVSSTALKKGLRFWPYCCDRRLALLPNLVMNL